MRAGDFVGAHNFVTKETQERETKASTSIPDLSDSSKDHAARKRRNTFEEFTTSFEVDGAKPNADEYYKTTIRQYREKATQQANQTIAVTQRLTNLEDYLNSIEATLFTRGHDLDRIDRECLTTRSQQLPTKVACLAESDNLRNQIVDLERNTSTLETAAVDLQNVVRATRQESQSIAHQCEEAKQELQLVTKQIKDEKTKLESTKNLLTSTTRNYDEKIERYNDIDTKLQATADSVECTKKDTKVIKKEYNVIDKQLDKLQFDLRDTKKRYNALLWKLDDKLRALNKAKDSIYRSSQEF